MTRKTTLGLIAIFLWIALGACLAAVIVLAHQVQTAPVEYTEVEVLITDIRHEPEMLTRGTHDVVTVRYEGKDYELISVLDGEVPQYQARYETGLPVTVYMAGGELYSNINGIKSHNVRGRTYGALVSVGGALLLGSIVVTGTYFDVVKKSRAAKADGMKEARVK